MNQLLWKTTSISKDWSDGILFNQIFKTLIELEAIGNIEWIDKDEKDVHVPASIQDSNEILDILKTQVSKRKAVSYIKFGGKYPNNWSCLFTLSRFLPAENLVEDLNKIDFFFQPEKNIQTDLVRSFKQINKSYQTEYASIHDYEHRWFYMSEKIYAKRPLCGVFDGVYWINYFGKRIWEVFFNQEKLKELNAYDIEWLHQNKNLFLQTFEDLNQYNAPEAEEEMKRIYKLFGKARKK